MKVKNISKVVFVLDTTSRSYCKMLDHLMQRYKLMIVLGSEFSELTRKMFFERNLIIHDNASITELLNQKTMKRDILYERHWYVYNPQDKDFDGVSSCIFIPARDTEQATLSIEYFKKRKFEVMTSV